LADERAEQILNLNRQLDKLEALYNEGQKNNEILEAGRVKNEAEIKKLSKSYQTMKDQYAELKD
jgi:flagellar motility protein MotE (MotC chaperone)